MAFQLIAAIANTSLLGSNPGSCPRQAGGTYPVTLIEDARRAAACNDIGNMRTEYALLSQFNQSGDAGILPGGLKACTANPAIAKARAVDPTTAATCNDSSHCAAGRSCP